jgi:hypothetical protein
MTTRWVGPNAEQMEKDVMDATHDVWIFDFSHRTIGRWTRPRPPSLMTTYLCLSDEE